MQAIDNTALIELDAEVSRQLGRLHDDEAKNTGKVEVDATTLRTLLTSYANRFVGVYRPGDVLQAVECPKCGHQFNHKLV